MEEEGLEKDEWVLAISFLGQLPCLLGRNLGRHLGLFSLAYTPLEPDGEYTSSLLSCALQQVLASLSQLCLRSHCPLLPKIDLLYSPSGQILFSPLGF